MKRIKVEDRIILVRSLISQGKSINYTDESVDKMLSYWRKNVSSVYEKYDFSKQEEIIKFINENAENLTSKAAQIAANVGFDTAKSEASILSWDGKVKNFNAMNLSKNQWQGIAMASKINGKSMQENFVESFKGDLIPHLEKMKVQGINPRVMSRILKKSVASGESVRKLETLCRTYAMTAASYAKETNFRKNEDLIKGYRHIATLETTGDFKGSGTCKTCAALDFYEYGKDDERKILPVHPNCRCTIVPITKTFRELGLDVDEMNMEYRRFKDLSESGHIIEQGVKANFNFKDLFFTGSEKLQDGIMGKRRADLLRSGKVEWHQLVDTKTSTLRTLKELEKYYK